MTTKVNGSLNMIVDTESDFMSYLKKTGHGSEKIEAELARTFKEYDLPIIKPPKEYIGKPYNSKPRGQKFNRRNTGNAGLQSIS